MGLLDPGPFDPVGEPTPGWVAAHNQAHPFVYRCDAAATFASGGPGPAVVVTAAGHIHAFEVAEWTVGGQACPRPADYAWRVRSRTHPDQTWIIGRCRGPHTDQIKRHLASPACGYDVVDYLLPVEMPPR